jgi:prevent-host-death family protein
MRLKDDIRPVTWLKANAAQMLEQINSTRSPVIITQNGVARAVVQDPESYDKTQQALALLKMIAMSEREIAEGRGIPQDEVFDHLLKKLEARKKAARR